MSDVGCYVMSDTTFTTLLALVAALKVNVKPLLPSAVLRLGRFCVNQMLMFQSIFDLFMIVQVRTLVT